jgi:hypothetical protein
MDSEGHFTDSNTLQAIHQQLDDYIKWNAGG